MKIEITEVQPSIDALEFAINQIHCDIEQGTLHNGPIAANAIRELQMIQVAYMLVQRNAAKEQR
jgi:hypothetical protein